MLKDQLGPETQKLLEGLQEKLIKLPEPVRIALLSHVLGQSNQLKETLLPAIPGEASLPEDRAELRLIKKKELFIAKYNIRIEPDNIVSLTIPAGSRPIDLISEARELCLDLYGLKAVSFSRLKRWRADKRFTALVSTEPAEKTICGYVPDSENTSEHRQYRNGWNNVLLQDLATAHAAYLVATSNDLFAGHPVRTKYGEVLNFAPYGIVCSKNARNYDRTPVAACKRIS